MLEIKIEERELFDERTSMFITLKPVTLKLEHSLISISKWESKWHKSFLSNTERTNEELIDYVRCMTLNTNVDPDAYFGLSRENQIEIDRYINDTMTATWFNERKQNGKPGGKGQVITSELIYYWMIAFEIPFECQKWHLNRLLTLIRICEIKNQPSKKMRKRDILAGNRSLNESRKRALGTKG